MEHDSINYSTALLIEKEGVNPIKDFIEGVDDDNYFALYLKDLLVNLKKYNIPHVALINDTAIFLGEKYKKRYLELRDQKIINNDPFAEYTYLEFSLGIHEHKVLLCDGDVCYDNQVYLSEDAEYFESEFDTAKVLELITGVRQNTVCDKLLKRTIEVFESEGFGVFCCASHSENIYWRGVSSQIYFYAVRVPNKDIWELFVSEVRLASIKYTSITDISCNHEYPATIRFGVDFEKNEFKSERTAFMLEIEKLSKRLIGEGE